MPRTTRVLVVEDNQVERADLAQMISSFGITPVTASDGQDAIEKLDSCDVDVILTDLVMPRMDGFALLSTLKARNPNVPAIMFASRVTPQERARADAAGVRTVLEKPLLDNVLMDNIRAILDAGA